MAIAKRISEQMAGSSWIRKMFEEAEGLRRQGVEVFDFTLGNPRIDPPARFTEALIEVARSEFPGKHGYMPNAGLADVREAVAAYVSREQGVSLDARHVIMTCGAAGAMNVVLKAVLNPGDQVLTSAPYFVEYGTYAENHGGALVPVPARGDFDLDVEALALAVSPRTAAMILNSPNNPTGRVYPEATIRALGEALETRSREIGRPILLVSDEPYRKLVYDGAVVPSVMQAYRNSVVLTSYSKDLSIPGERIGLAAVHPDADGSEELVAALTVCNRSLGYVNAPVLMQRVVARVQGESVDVEIYRRNRDALYQGLTELGYELGRPEGAFYLFPKAPGGDELAFVAALRRERVLAVPSSGFGIKGYFRLAYCVEPETIPGSLPSFARAVAPYR
ncbi:MAG: pyridoxal phosphate-dependent aminotransferase [Spirochaetales bacterium]|nr:pyridoxal phosphate-dependent aminotransferase [Spirochaetales bacterium]